jgi:hypothetical protein
MTMTTTTVVAISVAAVVVVYALWVGIPLWMVLARDEEGPETDVPEYLRIHQEHFFHERERELTRSGR